ncbi:MAG: hypothetical protein KatS3mg046_463 [Bellilinea sp.]|jgi:hypothetical protein|nr:MAG: hypothetical protein KatS3mg046_463 [Bellilinea sp.]
MELLFVGLSIGVAAGVVVIRLIDYFTSKG